MTKTDKSETALSRRKMLGRIGLLAVAGYSVPAFTTLSMAQAGSGASGGGNSGASTSGASTSGASTSGASASGASTSGPSGTTPADVCGPENVGDPIYDQCVIDNGL